MTGSWTTWEGSNVNINGVGRIVGTYVSVQRREGEREREYPDDLQRGIAPP